MAADVTIFARCRQRIPPLELLLIVILLVLSALIRAWGLDYDLPYIYHPDEPSYMAISQRIFQTGDLNPRFFNYPSLLFYINALAYIPYYFFGRFMGVFHVPADILPPISLAMGVSKAQMPMAALLGRTVTACFGVGVVGLVYLIGKRMTGRLAVAALAALMVAISPTAVWHSRFVTPDTFVVFFSLAALLLSVLVYQHGKTWQYVTAGICVGLTASSKYNGALIVLPLVLAHFLRYNRTALKQPKLYLALLCCAVGFLATTPFAVLDSAKFLSDFRFEAQHYSSGHTGMERDTLKWYLTYMWDTNGGLYLLAFLGILYGCVLHPKTTSLLSVFPLVYFVFINGFVVRNDKTLLPSIPFLFLLAAWFSVEVFDRLRTLRTKSLRTLAFVIFAGLVCIALALSVSKVTATTRLLIAVNSRETARMWIADNLPTGTKIAIESYAPFVDPSRFSVQGFWGIIDHGPEWYVEQAFDYLVFSQGIYGRFYREPELYKKQVAQYDSFFERFNLLMIFTDGGYEVRIYKVR